MSGGGKRHVSSAVRRREVERGGRRAKEIVVGSDDHKSRWNTQVQ